MLNFILHRVLGPLVGTIIAKAILSGLNALGIYPSKWLLERVMTAPTDAWIEFATWLVAAALGIGGYALLAWLNARRRVDGREGEYSKTLKDTDEKFIFE